MSNPAHTDAAEALRHIQVLHPFGSYGRVTLAHTPKRGSLHDVEDCHSPDMLQDASFVSINRHGERRRSKDLVALNGGLWVDLDIDDINPFAKVPPEDLCALLLTRLKDAQLVPPSYILYSGRGLWCVWLLTKALHPAAAPMVRSLMRILYGPPSDREGLPIFDARSARDERFMKTARRMHAVWEGFNLDRQVLDTQRLHRLSGSINDKSGRRVRLLWPQQWSEVSRRDIESLRECVHPYSKREIDQFKKRLARDRDTSRQSGEKPRSVRPSCRVMSRLGVVADDLIRFIDYLGPDGLRNRRRRELAAFHLATAWANAGRQGDVRDWAPELSRMTGIELRELERSLQTLDEKLQAERAGTQVEYAGQTWSPVYGYRMFRIVEDLGITDEDAKAAGTRLLVPGGGAPLTDKERSAAYRRRRDATSHKQAEADRQAAGLVALRKRHDSASFRAIATELGRSETYVRKAYQMALAESADRARDSSRSLLAARPAAESRQDPEVGFEPVDAEATRAHYFGVLLAYQIRVASDRDSTCRFDPHEVVIRALDITVALRADEIFSKKAAFPHLYRTENVRNVSIKSVYLNILISKGILRLELNNKIYLSNKYC